MSRVLIGSTSSLIPASASFGAAKRRLAAKVARSLSSVDTRRRDAGEAVHLLAAERGRVFDRLPDTVLELSDAVGMACDAALALRPVAGGEVMQHLNELMPVEPLAELGRGIRVGEQILHALEARLRRRLEAVEEVDFVVEHRHVRAEPGH